MISLVLSLIISFVCFSYLRGSLPARYWLWLYSRTSCCRLDRSSETLPGARRSSRCLWRQTQDPLLSQGWSDFGGRDDDDSTKTTCSIRTPAGELTTPYQCLPSQLPWPCGDAKPLITSVVPRVLSQCPVGRCPGGQASKSKYSTASSGWFFFLSRGGEAPPYQTLRHVSCRNACYC